MAKDKYKGPTPEEMDRVARMMEANIPPIAPSRLEELNDNSLNKKSKSVKMPELKTKDTGDKMEFDFKGEKIKGYENAKPMKKGGSVKKMAKGGSVSSASKRADGCATKGKTKGRII